MSIWKETWQNWPEVAAKVDKRNPNLNFIAYSNFILKRLIYESNFWFKYMKQLRRRIFKICFHFYFWHFTTRTIWPCSYASLCECLYLLTLMWVAQWVSLDSQTFATLPIRTLILYKVWLHRAPWCLFDRKC